MKSLTSELYDYNTFDDMGILGPHPYHNNLFIAAGFGKQGTLKRICILFCDRFLFQLSHQSMSLMMLLFFPGCSHAPGIGRGIAELIIDSHFISIDLTRLTFDRLFTDQPLYEFNIY